MLRVYSSITAAELELTRATDECAGDLDRFLMPCARCRLREVFPGGGVAVMTCMGLCIVVGLVWKAGVYSFVFDRWQWRWGV